MDVLKMSVVLSRFYYPVAGVNSAQKVNMLLLRAMRKRGRFV